MRFELKAGLITVVCALALAVPAWVAISGNALLSPVHPFPMLTVVALFFSDYYGRGLAGVLIIWPVLFLLWNPPLLWGAPAAPTRTYVLWLIITVLSVAQFTSYLIDWDDFSKRWHDVEGIQKWRTLGLINGGLAVLVGLMLLRIRDHGSSFSLNLLLHWTLFAWLASSAFPAPELP